ncbi:hypothetical protein FACS189437_09360 [Bacteroidia bacterium]|nr:hypothetical protein FACS189437_09360 [Bacteroidia bacterium]
MRKKIFLSFWLLLTIDIVTVMFNSCSKDDNIEQYDPLTDKGVIINGVKWATRNVDKPSTFAAKLEDAGMFYQWNRNIGWSATNPMVNSNDETEWEWMPVIPEDDSWTKVNDPSPVGWRLPTLDEIKSLLNTEKVNSEWTTVKGITGRKFTDKSTGNSIFLPAAGYRNEGGGTLYNRGDGGNYWSSMQLDSEFAYCLIFWNDHLGWFDNGRWNCRSIRSVAE